MALGVIKGLTNEKSNPAIALILVLTICQLHVNVFTAQIKLVYICNLAKHKFQFIP